MPLITTPVSRLELSRALRFILEALDILDELGAPGEIGSTLDLAASRLEKFLDHDDQAAAGAQLSISQLEREFQVSAARGQHKPSPWDFPMAR